MQKFEMFEGETFYLELHRDEEVLSEIIREKGFYSYNDLYVFRSLLERTSVFVDVGANIGWHTLAMAAYLKNGRVFAFEPELRNYQLLEKSITTSGFTNVTCLSKALSDYTGFGSLSLSGGNYGDHILDPSNLLDSRPEVKVEVITGDSYFSKLDPSMTVDLIKIDAQGSEPKILKGLKNTIKIFQPSIMIEFSPRHIIAAGGSIFEIFAFIEKNSYIPFQILEDLDRPKNKLLDFVSVEKLLSASQILMERGTGVDILLLKKAQIDLLISKGFEL